MSTEWTLDTSDIIELLTLKNIVSWICSGAMIVGGVVPYVPQYKEIRKTDNADGFSTYVCLVLLIANTLRIMFWFGHPFELPLLCQSIIMNIAMLAMIQLCVHVRNKTMIVPVKTRLFSESETEENKEVILNHPSSFTPRSYWDLDTKYFWEWSDFLSYLEFLATFTAVMGIFMYFCLDIAIVVESIGYLAVFIEAMLGAPQFYRNFKKKSTIGMSKRMVFLWCIGDIFKTSYYYVREAPTQFWLCGILQIYIDAFIIFQTIIYRTQPVELKTLLKGESHTK